MSLNITSNVGVIGCIEKSIYISVAYQSNYFAYSTDGINWTESTISNTSRYWNSVCYGNGKFVAVSNSTNVFAYSTNGTSWTEGTISGTSRNWKNICYGNGVFVVVAWNSSYIAYSTNGITWTEVSIGSYLGPICYGNGQFVILSYNGTNVLCSNNGINWYIPGRISNYSRSWNSVCYGNGKFVAITQNSRYSAYSYDGSYWYEYSYFYSANYEMLCYGNGKYVALNRGTNIFIYSSDGINWNTSTASGNGWFSLYFNNNSFIALGQSNSIAYSTNGITWSIVNSTLNPRLWYSICYGNNLSNYDMLFNSSRPTYSSKSTFNDKVILYSIVHHDSPMHLLINRINTDNNFYIYSPILGNIVLTDSNRKIYPVGNNMNRNCIGGALHPLGDGYVAYSIYSNNMGVTNKQDDATAGDLELITGVIKANPYLASYMKNNSQGFYGINNDIDNFLQAYKYIGQKYNTEISINYSSMSGYKTDVHAISTMTTYVEQYTEYVYYIHYAWVSRPSSSLIVYNIFTRKIDTTSYNPIISNLTSYTTTFSISTIAHPSFHKDKNGIHCAFYHGNTTYTKYYKLTRSGTDDSTWRWGADSNTYITNENISLMVNKNENNLQSSVAQSARRMYIVNSSNNLVEFKKTQIF